MSVLADACIQKIYLDLMIKKTIASFLFALMLVSGVSAKDYTKWVNPNIGTAHSRWFFYTPAALPFGMAKGAPSTNGSYGNQDGWQAVGYDARHNTIEGFACAHEFQVGGLLVMPTVGNLQLEPGEVDKPESGYRSSFDKADEYATAGYYSVKLKDYGIKAELTATERVVIQRFTFPKSGLSHIIFDIGRKMGESGPVVDANVVINSDGSLQGKVITLPAYVQKYQRGAQVPIYFYATVSKKPKSCCTFSTSTSKAGAYLDFDTEEGETVEVKVAVSYTSEEGAKRNYDAEAVNLDFDTAHKRATEAWNECLGRIDVEGNNEANLTKFYTGLFHAMLGRGVASDVDGKYPRNDGSVGQIELVNGKPKCHLYNTDSMWGSYWNLTLLWALAYPERYNDFIAGQLLVYKDTGWLGDGIANSRYVSGMGTNFISLVTAAAYNCGLRNYDVKLAYEAALKNELGWDGRPDGAGKSDTKVFLDRGYSPYIMSNNGEGDELHRDGSPFGASHTLENSFTAYAVSQFAKAMGKSSDYKKLQKLSQGWRLLFDSETGFIRPRDINGDFVTPFDPSAPWIGFQEGNAYQYTFFVPHDVAGLAKAIGVDRFNARLDSVFTDSRKAVFGGGTTINAFAGLSGVYNHGNQPCLHIPWMFNFTGRPDLSQKWVRIICDEFYGTEEIHGYGYGQDEDQGQLGAWYVMASIGLFDVKGLSDQHPSYQIGSPLFDKVTVKVPGRPVFVIDAENNGSENYYIQSATLNGRNLKTLSLPYSDLLKGGTLCLKLAGTPVKK